jgi:hypothetical protein
MHLVSALAVLAVCSTALAQTGGTSTKVMSLTGPLSQAELIQGLKDHGYNDIKVVTGYAPQISDPHPELSHGFRSPHDPAAQVTPVHLGWNGTAVKDGNTYDIFIRDESPASVPGNVAGERKGREVNVYLDHVLAGAR